jgi:4-hydroxy-3-methylbut-2-enyl diphosphate reductase
VEIDPRSGFCFGVVRAIRRAEEILKQEGSLYCLGQIVHNDEEVKRLEALGMVTLQHSQLADIHNSNVLIRAHGEPPETYEMLRRNGNEILDATCPIVLRLQDRIQDSEEEGDYVLIFGKKDHPEVIGLMGHISNNGQVFSSIEDLDLSLLPGQVTLYSQTTMNVDQLYEVRQLLEQSGIQVKLKDTVCRQVSGRRRDMTDFCRSHDRIIFVAGRNSSNGKVLYTVCHEVNDKSHKIASVDEIDPSWFAPGESIGICGATSTPKWLMEDVRDYLLTL